MTDGPFTESKEIVGGMAIIPAPSKEAAIPWIKQFVATAGNGDYEVRQLWDQPAS
ncbi:MAG TPA: YciI family protein [Vicinamibacterales bacterium]|nr:YciI family protein [Vicinamibacterales bacterium]